MKRRALLVFAFNGTLFTLACQVSRGNPIAPQASNPPPQQSPNTSTPLLTRVKNLGYTNARRVSYAPGGYQIYINDHPNWNFLVNDTAIGLYSGTATTIDVAAHSIPDSAKVSVRRS